MKSLAYGYLAAALCMLVLDAIWLSTMTRLLYRPHLGGILLDGFRLAPAILFYLLYVGGIVFFAVKPALRSGDWTVALLNGAVLGLIAYGAYDLTNQATLSIWSTTVTVIDMSWGVFLTAVTACAGYQAARYGAG